MSFSFGFSNEDLSDDEITSSSSAVPETVQDKYSIDPFASFTTSVQNEPRELSLQEILKSLVGNRFTFSSIEISGFSIYRRELFDIKHQLMLEDHNAKESEFQILIGETNEDLKNQVYEGGLKSWECSVDAVEYLINSAETTENTDQYVELGCGTALPSLYLFAQTLSAKTGTPKKFLLSDFNKSVLRLVTIPNILINWAKRALSEDQSAALQRSVNSETPIVEDELEITEALVEAFYQDLSQRNLQMRFIHGSWCRDFVKLMALNPSDSKFLVTSETIYSPEILPIIGETLLQVKSTSSGVARVLVTAKDIYFGVGGSVNELLKFFEARQRHLGLDLQINVQKLDSNLKRSIITVE